MRKHLKLGLLIAVACLSGIGTSSAAVTAQDALVLGKKLCASLIYGAISPVKWSVTVSDGHSNQLVSDGDYWLVDGQYYPKTPPGKIAVLAVVDLLLFVPKNGTPPAACTSAVN